MQHSKQTRSWFLRFQCAHNVLNMDILLAIGKNTAWSNILDSKPSMGILLSIKKITIWSIIFQEPLNLHTCPHMTSQKGGINDVTKREVGHSHTTCLRHKYSSRCCPAADFCTSAQACPHSQILPTHTHSNLFLSFYTTHSPPPPSLLRLLELSFPWPL